MKSIKDNITYKQEINKSIFITELYKVKSIEEIKSYLKAIKTKYKDATHYCYAYIIDDIKKSSDDGEPGGTAGVPIMEVLLKNDLNYVLCIVIRYFGGIKLGSGGLARAYSSSVSNSLINASIVNLCNGYNIYFSVDYKLQNKIDYIFKNYIFSKTYDETVNYKLSIKEKDIQLLENNNIKYKILEKIKIED